MINPEKRGVHELVKSVHEAVTHGIFLYKKPRKIPEHQCFLG